MSAEMENSLSEVQPHSMETTIGYRWRGHRFNTDPASRQEIFNRALQILIARSLLLPDRTVHYPDADQQIVQFRSHEFLRFAHGVGVMVENLMLAEVADNRGSEYQPVRAD